ncbi:MAG: Gfo/Idh/MocA family oxidoreductase [Candidatus Acidiferrales bacterium]
MKIIVIGAGSIGERHVRAFRRIDGILVSLVDPRKERTQKIAERYGCDGSYPRIEAAPLDSFDAAVIATPANSHIPIGIACASRGLHLLIEKPLAASIEGVGELVTICESKPLIAAVGYTLRFDPTIVKLRELVQSGLAGQLLSVRSVCTHYLPDSRPDYKQAYYGTSNAGAGVILDLSHEFNYVEWILGDLKLEACRRAQVLKLNIADEAIADMWLLRSDGLLAQIHLHAADKHLSRECYVVGSEATLAANILTGEILIERGRQERERIQCTSDRDEAHLAEALDFIDAIRQKRSPRCTIQEALRTLQASLEAMKAPLLDAAAPKNSTS